ncbi:MAG TPA: endonuclease III [Thermoanaerobaculia bacterium]
MAKGDAKAAGGARQGGGITMAQARRESPKVRRERAAEIFRRLSAEYPHTRIALDFGNAYELLVATILAAQCTDKRVNVVTPALFRRYPSPRELAVADLAEVEELVHSINFFHNKSRALVALGQTLVNEHGGEVPKTMEELEALPGVGRKTANVVLANAFGIDVGIVIDTHGKRLSGRLGFSTEDDPEKIERDLMEVVPREWWTPWAHLMADHGRAVCIARKPACGRCVVAELCPSAEV